MLDMQVQISGLSRPAAVVCCCSLCMYECDAVTDGVVRSVVFLLSRLVVLSVSLCLLLFQMPCFLSSVNVTPFAGRPTPSTNPNTRRRGLNITKA